MIMNDATIRSTVTFHESAIPSTLSSSLTSADHGATSSISPTPKKRRAMPCPFATLAKLTGARLDPSSHAMYHPQASLSTDDAEAVVPGAAADTYDVPLSARLQQGTARAHTAIERSRGVRALMGLARGKREGEAMTLERSEYIAWLVGLACIYRTLERYLNVSAPLLEPLQSILDLPSLYRTASLEDDVRAHIRAYAHITISASSASRSAEESEALEALAHPTAGASTAHRQLAALLTNLPDTLSSATDSRAQFPTAQHLAIMSPLHADAVLKYSQRLDDLGRAAVATASGRSTPSDEGVCLTPLEDTKSAMLAQVHDATRTPDLLLSHAYVRYMGDLSGGQHIAKRAKALWPIDDRTSGVGFGFYHFQRPAYYDDSQRAWEMSLKRDFRRAMDAGFGELAEQEKETMSPLLVDEASMAFDLNRGLFDALVPSSETDELADQAELEEHMRRLAKAELRKLPVHLRFVAAFAPASSAFGKLAVPSTLALALAVATCASAAAA